MNKVLKEIILNNLKQYKALSDTEMNALILYICTYRPDIAFLITKYKGINKFNIKKIIHKIEQVNSQSSKKVKKI